MEIDSTHSKTLQCSAYEGNATTDSDLSSRIQFRDYTVIAMNSLYKGNATHTDSSSQA